MAVRSWHPDDPRPRRSDPAFRKWVAIDLLLVIAVAALAVVVIALRTSLL